MKKLILLVLIVVCGLSTTPMQSECAECKKLQHEVVEAWKHSVNLAKEIRALTKDLVSYSAQIRKHNVSY